jgi:hypothetical protein
VPETEEAQQAAANLTESLIVDMANAGNQNALEIIQKAQEVAGEPEPVGEPAAPEAAAEPVQAAPVAAPFELNPTLPDDIVAELDAADIDAEVDAEVAQIAPREDEYGNPVYVDEESERERIALRKRNEYLERQLADSKSSQWKAEGAKFFPLAQHALDDIAKTATSRRSFLRLAKAEHERILPHVQGYLAEAKLAVDAESEEAKAQAREGVAVAWGTPLAGPEGGISETANQEARIERARQKGRLADVFAEMMRK